MLHIISIFLIIGNVFGILENGYQDYEISLKPVDGNPDLKVF